MVTTVYSPNQSSIQPGDIILNINNHVIENQTCFLTTISSLPVGSNVVIKLVRDGKILNIKTHTEPLSTNSPFCISNQPIYTSSSKRLKGIIFDQITVEQINYLKVHHIKHNSPASKLGFQQGDIIYDLNEINIYDIHQLNETIYNNSLLIFKIARNNKFIYHDIYTGL
ncbi:MAG: PDZ domain-containing protein [Candidatus Dasytiphilus stammeri]